MESNKDEALKCLLIARKHLDAENFPSAIRFCQKSINLYTTKEAEDLLATVTEQQKAAESGSTTSTATEEHPSGAGFRHRAAKGKENQVPSASSSGTATPNGTASGIGGDKREFTAEQHAVVKRVRTCKVTEYYEILAVQKDCEEADIKKAYRKLALALHPDKNGAPGADEAFKMVSKAFQVLSDPQKRAAFDSHGSDPEDRTSGMQSGFRNSPFAGGGGFEGELNPEDLFNMFFGGGGFGGGGFQQAGFGGGFGGPPIFTATFGGPGGFRTQRFGGGAMPRRAAENQGNNPRSMLVQLLPLIIFFGFSLLSALPNLFSTPPIPDPNFSFTPSTRFNMERRTDGLGLRYHVNAREFTTHPHIAADLAAADSGTRNAEAIKKFETKVENYYKQELYLLCQRGVDQKERRKEAEVGIFGIGTDWEKVRRIEQEKIESCEELKRLGVIAS